MSDEKGPEKQENKMKQEEPARISIQEILNNYPIDRDKCRDILFLEVSKHLVRIADSLKGISQGIDDINTHLSEANRLRKIKQGG